jgi:hypothetical protein
MLKVYQKPTVIWPVSECVETPTVHHSVFLAILLVYFFQKMSYFWLFLGSAQRFGGLAVRILQPGGSAVRILQPGGSAAREQRLGVSAIRRFRTQRLGGSAIRRFGTQRLGGSAIRRLGTQRLGRSAIRRFGTQRIWAVRRFGRELRFLGQTPRLFSQRRLILVVNSNEREQPNRRTAGNFYLHFSYQRTAYFSISAFFAISISLFGSYFALSLFTFSII